MRVRSFGVERFGASARGTSAHPEDTEVARGYAAAGSVMFSE
jgi:hypothetical protein